MRGQTFTCRPPTQTQVRRSLDEPAAFGAVFDRHYGAVHAYAQRRVGAELAEEVAAEAFARAFAARKRYDGAHADALPRLLGIASNLMRRHWRTEKRRLNAYARVASQHVPDVDPATAEEVITAVARLPRRQREVVLLHVWADLSYEQIARALDIPVGTVRSSASRRSRSPGCARRSPAFRGATTSSRSGATSAPAGSLPARRRSSRRSRVCTAWTRRSGCARCPRIPAGKLGLTVEETYKNALGC